MSSIDHVLILVLVQPSLVAERNSTSDPVCLSVCLSVRLSVCLSQILSQIFFYIIEEVLEVDEPDEGKNKDDLKNVNNLKMKLT